MKINSQIGWKDASTIKIETDTWLHTQIVYCIAKEDLHTRLEATRLLLVKACSGKRLIIHIHDLPW